MSDDSRAPKKATHIWGKAGSCHRPFLPMWASLLGLIGLQVTMSTGGDDSASEKGYTRICRKAGSRHSPLLPDPNCPLWRDRFDLFPVFYDHMLVTEDGRRFPCGMVTLWSMSGNLGDKVEAEKRRRNLGPTFRSQSS